MLEPVQDNQHETQSKASNATSTPLIITEPLNTPEPAQIALEVFDLCKSFNGLRAVDHLSLMIKKREIFGLLGPNGSGKTTTINMITGLSVPSSGEIRVMGFDMSRQTRQMHRILGAVPQETALYEDLTAWQNMDLHADLFSIPRREKRQRITTMLELVQLIDQKNIKKARVRTFSGGMKRRLALARALLHEPQLIVLDEPTLGVDVQSRRAIWDYIVSQRDQGRTVLLMTNYLEEAQALCDRLAIIDHGKLVALDTPNNMKRRYGDRVLEIITKEISHSTDKIQALVGVLEVRQEGTHLKIVVQRESEDIVSQVITLLASDGQVHDISTREPQLDEIFLRLTGTVLRD